MQKSSSRRGRSSILITGVALAFLGGFGAFDKANASHPLITVEDLGTLGGTSSNGIALNDRGDVVGVSSIPGDLDPHPFFWSAHTGMNALSLSRGSANAINNTDQVTGWIDSPEGQGDHAFRWTEREGLKDLGTLGAESFGYAINLHLIAGVSSTSPVENSEEGFIWTERSGMVSIGNLSHGALMSIKGLNVKDEVVGNSGASGFIWRPGSHIVPLSPLTGRIRSLVNAINDRGDIAGFSDQDGSEATATLWPKGGAPVALPSLPNSTSSIAVAINNAGDVAGSSGNLAALWPHNKAPVNLGLLKQGSNPRFDSSGASAINNRGDVVGSSTDGLGLCQGRSCTRAFVWTPELGMVELPPPATVSGRFECGAVAINNKRQILGFCTPFMDPDHARALLWTLH